MDTSSARLALTSEEEGYVMAWNASLEFVKPMVIKAAILLGIPDALHRRGPLTLEEIAEETSSKNIDMLSRVLRFLVVHRLFSEIKVEDSWKYGLTEASSWLVRSKEKTLVPYILMLLNDHRPSPWHQLHDCILDEDNKMSCFARAYGMPIYEFMALNPHASDMFNDAMAARSRASIDTILKHKHVFQGIKTLVDVGGGIGLVTSKLVEAFPFIKGINFDLPHVIAKATTLHPEVEHIAGNMFEELPSADALLLKMVLHGYDDETCLKLLRNCYKALPDDGKLVVVDFLLSEGEPAGYAADMLMATTSVSGRDRTQSEWINLLASASFVHHKFHTMILDSMCMIEAFK